MADDDDSTRARRSCRPLPLLVLDLDETLVSSSTSVRPNVVTDREVRVTIDGTAVTVYVSLRPHVREFLESVLKYWDVFLFTAAAQTYADAVIDEILDPERKIFQRRLYRQHCTLIDGVFVKNLGQLGRPLEQIVIIDNTPAAYSLNPDNALPIFSWHGGPGGDRELYFVIPALKALSKEPDKLRTLREYRDILYGTEWERK